MLEKGGVEGEEEGLRGEDGSAVGKTGAVEVEGVVLSERAGEIEKGQRYMKK